MSAYIRTPFKSGVTGVTRVTTYAKRPNSLTFTSVTRMRGYPFTRCNAAPRCNVKTSPRPLWADIQRAPSKGLSLVTPTKFRAWDRGVHDARDTDQ
jgi:hypothetical protein